MANFIIIQVGGIGMKNDWRVKCGWCGNWMKNSPTEKTPLKRAAAPHANYCIYCVELDHTPTITLVKRIA